MHDLVSLGLSCGSRMSVHLGMGLGAGAVSSLGLEC